MSPLDPALLEHAREAAVDVIEAEKQLEVAKAEYHAQVRRLHLAGASLREIAAALGISHQRVQQIVDDAGGSWWTRVWRNRGVTELRDTQCSFCKRTRGQVEKLISGPDFFICDACVHCAERVARARLPHTPFAPAAIRDRARCSFCGVRPGNDRRTVAGGERRLCTQCLQQCRAILDETT